MAQLMEQQLLPKCYVALRLGARNHAVARVVEEPLGAVVVEAVVHLVAESGAVVVQMYQLPRQVHPLPTRVVSIDEDLVARGLPVLLLPRYVGEPHPVVEGHNFSLIDRPQSD